MIEPLEPLVALAFASFPEPVLVRRLAAELVRQAERDDPQVPVELLHRQAMALVRRAAVPCGRRRRVADAVLAEAARQSALRKARAEVREVVVARFDLGAARSALAEARRCRQAGEVVEVMSGYFRVRSGRGWRPIPWRRLP